jgi:broad specificity phosphatase PhoE
MSSRRIFLARHGNRQDFVDHDWLVTAEEPYDPPLSADGVEQARRLGQRLAGEGIAAIIASPFLRTIQTAHHANEAIGVPIFLDPGFGEWLTERSFERLPRLQALDVLRRDYPMLGSEYVSASVLRHPESFDELRARSQQALEALLGKVQGTLLVVSHAAAVAAMAMIDTRVQSVDCPLCALFCLEHDGSGWRLTLAGDTGHLEARLGECRLP